MHMYHIGIDWGTQSSKVYTYDDENKSGNLGVMCDSTLFYDKRNDIVGFSDEFLQNIGGGSPDIASNLFSIKRQMIMNPTISFWCGESDDINLTLGASITLSLLALLRKAISDIELSNRENISEVCFSFPNWSPGLDIKHDIALKKFKQAAYLAVTIALNEKYDGLIPHKGIRNKEFQNVINKLLPVPDFPKFDIDKITQLNDKFNDKLSISYLPESLAAGLPYLLHLQYGSNHAFRLLVIDVGAGSTDIGYLTQWRLTKNDAFHMVYFKPAPAINYAGESITKAVARQFNLNSQDAEVKKISLSSLGTLSIEVPYVKDEWIRIISERVRDYICSLPKHILMDRPEPVRIIITGGSGAVPGLQEALKSKVEIGLAINENRPNNCPPRSLTAENISIQLDPNKDTFETGRRSVSIGAGQPSKSKLMFV